MNHLLKRLLFILGFVLLFRFAGPIGSRYILPALLIWFVWRVLQRSIRTRAGSASGTETAKRLQTPYEILDVPVGSDFDAIKAAYQNKIRQYHPDKVADMGPEVRQVAEKHAQEINEAYDILKKKFGQ
ncbi:MAG: J domain-containing protein [Myxococcota bacterium]|jgi:preprotein translocase subunit Sec63|nr:J domain-containing protein [Myxococcota bacterium]